jgi:molybdopterin-guanine dinucleotide biosynthesis protein B
MGFVGSSGSGKTTLIAAVVPLLTGAGLRVGVLKHARHGFDIDQPGKDSYRVREAGATRVMVASGDRWVMMGEEPSRFAEPPFSELLQRLALEELDLVLAEGFAGEVYPKIEVYRPAHGQPPKCWPGDRSVIAVASDAVLPVTEPVRLLDLNAPPSVAEFILERLASRSRSAGGIHAA